MFHITPGTSSVRGHHEQPCLVAREFDVVVTDSVDRAPVQKVLLRALRHSKEREQPDQVQRRQHDKREHVEQVARLRRLRDEAECDQRAGDRHDVQGRARGALAGRLRPRALKREVLSGQRGKELLAIRGFRHVEPFSHDARSPASAPAP
jgi:hypothetical protein